MSSLKNTALASLLLSASLVTAHAETPLPDAIAAPGESVVLAVHAEGAQVYDCKAGAEGKLAWAFREPIATLMADGKTVGRHYAGPNWESADGSAVGGILTPVTTVQRINTQGGKLDGACDKAGATRSAPYSADYVFLRKG